MKITKRFRYIGPIVLTLSLALMLSAFNAAVAQETDKEVEYEAGFYYTIKKGDTLWDISQRFNDTPWQWPDLWKENVQIPNPHWIYPGERIRLFRKSDMESVQAEQKEVPSAEPHVDVSTVTEKAAPEVYYYYSKIEQVGFIRKPPVQPNGVIFKALDDKKMISVDDLVYIRHPDSEPISELTPGSRWTVYRTMPPTENRGSETAIGTQHYLLGIVEITQNESQYAMGKIIKSFRVMHVGDLLMPYKPRTPEVTVSESTPGIEGGIIVSEEHNKMIGELMTAFINKGEDDHIVPGQLYTIYYQETAPVGTGGQEIALKPVDIGTLVVLHTEKNNSTVLVTDAKRTITTENKIRTP